VKRRFLLILIPCALLSCTPQAPPPASVTSSQIEGTRGPKIASRIRVDGLIEAREWTDPDTSTVLLPDGRIITVLRQRGPDSLDFAFIGLGGNVPRRIHPEILLDVSGRFPAQFSKDSWWFRIAPSRCVASGSTEALECDIQLSGFEASASPIDRQDNLEVRISFSLLEFNPTTTPLIAHALRFAEQSAFADATWPLAAELNRPDTWFRLDLSE